MTSDNHVTDALAYAVANAKLGEGPSVRCEGPTEFEINVAREWVERVQRAMKSKEQASVHSPDEVERLREALDSALDFVVDVINEATPGGIYHTNAVECHRAAIAALQHPAKEMGE